MAEPDNDPIYVPSAWQRFKTQKQMHDKVPTQPGKVALGCLSILGVLGFSIAVLGAFLFVIVYAISAGWNAAT